MIVPDVRLPGRKLGVEDMARTGLFEFRRKGAGLVRPWTDWRRRLWIEDEAECMEDGKVGDVGERVEADRLGFMWSWKGALVGAMEDMRRG